MPSGNPKKIEYYIDENECHICTSHAKDEKGYPRITRKGIQQRMSRYIYGQTYGKITKEICVCHTCDNRACINLEHLWVGTIQDNMKDRNNKNRQAKGENIGSNKLTELQVKEIMKSEETLFILSKKYKITPSVISAIKHRRTWKHVKGEINNINHIYGEKHANSKLTKNQVVDILNSNEKGTVLAKKYNVTPSNICAIRKRKSWNYI